jgi:hypothetical protein
MWCVYRSEDGEMVTEFGDKSAAHICKNALEAETSREYFVERG